MATGLGPGIRFESGGELKAASLLTGVWSCGVKSQVTEVVRVHLEKGLKLCKAQCSYVIVMCDLIVRFWVWLRNIDVIMINVNCECMVMCDTVNERIVYSNIYI